VPVQQVAPVLRALPKPTLAHENGIIKPRAQAVSTVCSAANRRGFALSAIAAIKPAQRLNALQEKAADVTAATYDALIV
jgi:hypothetical protein